MKNIYDKAKANGIYFYSDCTSITLKEHRSLMKGSTKANGSEIRKLIKKFLPDLYYNLALNFFNPYESQSRKKDGLFIYIHSSIEYFIKIH